MKRWTAPSHPLTASAGLALLSALSCIGSASALDIHGANAAYADKHYRFELTATIDAPLDRIEAVLRDYEKYPTLDPRILEARVLERPEPHIAVLQTRLRMCFGPFCREVKRVERVEESSGTLLAVADPARSDVQSCETRTALTSDAHRTQLSYRTDIVPNFWIPAMVGRRWMLSTLREATLDLFEQVERRAQAAAATPDAQTIDSTSVPERLE